MVALNELTATIEADRPAVDALLGRWVPQVSGKEDGTFWEGITYGLPEIAALHRDLDTRYGALLIDGAEYNFQRQDQPLVGWYFTVVDQPFNTSDGALDWCRQNQIDRDNCAAKLITNDQDADGTLVLQ